jgi:hypothetical protein
VAEGEFRFLDPKDNRAVFRERKRKKMDLSLMSTSRPAGFTEESDEESQVVTQVAVENQVPKEFESFTATNYQEPIGEYSAIMNIPPPSYYALCENDQELDQIEEVYRTLVLAEVDSPAYKNSLFEQMNNAIATYNNMKGVISSAIRKKIMEDIRSIATKIILVEKIQETKGK